MLVARANYGCVVSVSCGVRAAALCVLRREAKNAAAPWPPRAFERQAVGTVRAWDHNNTYIRRGPPPSDHPYVHVILGPALEETLSLTQTKGTLR